MSVLSGSPAPRESVPPGGPRPAGGFLSTTAGILTAAVLANLLWGSAPAFIKLGYEAFGIAVEDVMSKILFAGLRFTLAGFLALLSGSLLHRRALLPKRGSGGMILVLALLQTAFQYFFYYIGLSHTAGYKAALISPTSTFFALLFAALVFRQEKLTPQKVLGCLIGFAGVVLVSLSGQSGGGVRLDGEGFILLSSVCGGCGSVLMNRYSAREDPIVLCGWGFVTGGALMIAVGLAGGGRLAAASASAWPIMIYLGFLSAVAYSLWSMLLQRHPVSRVVVFSFLNPVFGVVLSAVLLDEFSTLNVPRCLLAMALVFLGVRIVNRPERHRKAHAA